MKMRKAREIKGSIGREWQIWKSKKEKKLLQVDVDEEKRDDGG